MKKVVIAIITIIFLLIIALVVSGLLFKDQFSSFFKRDTVLDEEAYSSIHSKPNPSYSSMEMVERNRNNPYSSLDIDIDLDMDPYASLEMEDADMMGM